MNRIRVSANAKLHAFQLAEQLERYEILNKLYTVYHQRVNLVVSKFNKRVDKERINLNHIKTFSWLVPLFKFKVKPYYVNHLFDYSVSKSLNADKNYDALICWSGMSICSIKQAKKDGKIVILERGSSHIEYQIPLLEDEYTRWGFQFKRDNRVIEQEIEEYEIADWISVPSEFVRKTFLDKGINKDKLFKNNFGSSSYFSPTCKKREKFTILYLGNLSLRKGLPYLFQALNLLEIDPDQYDVWFVGSIQPEIKIMLPKFYKSNWKFFGHINHNELPELISACSVAVHPSLEEGLSMVIPQLMSCGIPVISTTNTGGMDIIDDGVNGYIIPIRSPDAIAMKITLLYENSNQLMKAQKSAESFGQKFGTWNNYGDRYFSFLKSVCR